MQAQLRWSLAAVLFRSRGVLPFLKAEFERHFFGEPAQVGEEPHLGRIGELGDYFINGAGLKPQAEPIRPRVSAKAIHDGVAFASGPREGLTGELPAKAFPARLRFDDGRT